MVIIIIFNNKRVEVHLLSVKNIKEHILYAEDVEKTPTISKKKDVHHVDFPMLKWDAVNIIKLNKLIENLLYK